MGQEISKVIDISIVVPTFNEEESVGHIYKAINQELTTLGKSYEIIFVDDGSKDTTFKILREIAGQDERVKVVRFRRNFGQTAAIAAGFDHSRGNVIVTLDADLQNDPADIPRLLEKMNEGYDIVSGWRAKRKDPFISRKLPSLCANWLISRISGVHLHDYGCTLKAYSRGVIDNINLYGEMHRFIPALANWYGVDVAEIKVQHHPRKYGQSKYGISRTFRVILDLLTVKFFLNFSTRPIHVFGLFGLIVLFLGGAIGLYLSFLKLFMGVGLSGRPLLLLAILLIVLGVQFVAFGLLAEMMVRIYYEPGRKTTYSVKEVID